MRHFKSNKRKIINKIPKIIFIIPINTAYHICSCVYYILMILFLISAVYRFSTGVSMAWGYAKIQCPAFLKADIVFDVISVLGLFNILPAWVYSKSDETMLSVSYGNILRIVFREHSFNSVAQVFWTLTCVAFSKSSYSESALIALCIVFLGLLQQWIVVYSMILNQNICSKLSAYIWECHICKLFPDEKDAETLLQHGLICLAGDMPLRHAPYYQEYVKCFCILLYKSASYQYPNQCVKDQNFNQDAYIDQRVQYLYPCIQYWASNVNVVENQYALGDILESLTNILGENSTQEINSHCVKTIISAFVGGKLYYSCEQEYSMQVRYSELLDQLNICQRRFTADISAKRYDNSTKFVAKCILDYIPQVALAMGWMLFQYKIISWNKEWTSILPPPQTNVERDYILAAVKAMLGSLIKNDNENQNIFALFCEIALYQTQLNEQNGE